MKPGSVTHSIDTNQRFVELGFRQVEGGATVTLPADRAGCPPGFYMLFLLSAQGVPSVAHFIRIGQASREAGAFATRDAREQAAPPVRESLAARDKRIEAEAGGTRVVVGLTSRCPYGLASCWGGAYQTLKALKDVGAVKAVANASDSTAEVFLAGDGLPDVDSWKSTFQEMANGSYDFRGAEATLTGAVQEHDGNLILSGPGWSVRLAGLGDTEKVQWDGAQRKPAASTPGELAAYQDLRNRVRASGKLPAAVITGPLRTESGEPRLHVRIVD